MDSAGAGAFAVPLSPWRGGAVITLGGADFFGGGTFGGTASWSATEWAAAVVDAEGS
jgi:hypothetical protein